MKGVAVFIASFGYVGFFPIAPGTAGSLAALALFAFIRWIGVPVIELSAIVAVFAIGGWAAHGTEVALARKDPREYKYLSTLNANLDRVVLGPAVELTPSRGDVLFCHHLCVHATSDNVSSSPRLAILHKW
jgi:hypothetical protein